jgi:hypothetical protein
VSDNRFKRTRTQDNNHSQSKIRPQEDCALDLNFRPEFVREIEEKLEKGKFVKIKDFAEEYGLK